MKDNLTKSCNGHIYISENLLAPFYKTGGGGASEVLPLQKGKAEKVLAMLKGGRGAQQILR